LSGGLNPIAALCEARADVTFRSLAEVEHIARFAGFRDRDPRFRRGADDGQKLSGTSAGSFLTGFMSRNRRA